MKEKDWNKINWKNARRLRKVLSSQKIGYLAEIYSCILLREEVNLDYGDLIRQAEEHLPKNFNNVYYWVRLAYEMSQGEYGGIDKSTEIQHRTLSERMQVEQFLRVYGGDIDSWGGLEEVLKFANGD
ncbi:MAG: hypothetical protein QXX68_00585 [Candidatus Pacearchaeota archaeon]